MSDWAGFSDSDLQKLKQPSKAATYSDAGSQKPSNVSMSSGGRSVRKMSQTKTRLPATSNDVVHDIDDSMRLGKPRTPSKDLKVNNEIPSKLVGANRNSVESKPDSSFSSIGSNEKPPQVQEIKDKELGKELAPKEVVTREMSKLELFQKQQKIIEEQNKQKRKLLNHAICQRKLHATQEALKLKKIQHDLDELDKQLSFDVSLIRDRIEDVSFDVVEARKRYDRAENEFVKAKFELHNKEELKEQLTEHLCTMIRENEVRKAEKLMQLMQKLSLDVVDAEPASLPVIGQLNTDPLISKGQAHVESPPTPCLTATSREPYAGILKENDVEEKAERVPDPKLESDAVAANESETTENSNETAQLQKSLNRDIGTEGIDLSKDSTVDPAQA